MKRDLLKKILLLILGFAVFFLPACGAAKVSPHAERPPAEITTTVDKATANPGDIITFTLSAEYDPAVKLELPEIADTFKDFRIVSSGSTPPSETHGRISQSRWYKLQADISGSYVLDPVEVAYQTPGGKRETLKTPKIFLEIESLLKEGDAKDIRDIKPPVSPIPSYRTFLLIAAALLAAVGVFLLARWLYGRYRRRQLAAIFARKPAHEEALEALERLLKRRLAEQGRIREFCFEISGIVRRYMDARFGIPAIDLTTEEILQQAGERDGLIDGQVRPLLAEFLLETDLAKFAKHRLPANKIEKIVQHTITFIGKTTPVAAGQEPHSHTEETAHEHVSV